MRCMDDKHCPRTAAIDSPVGKFKSVKVISGSVEDEVWTVVNRTINSTSVYYIERFATRFIDQVDEAVMVDCAKVVTTGNESKTVRLAGENIRYGSTDLDFVLGHLSGAYGAGFYGGRDS